tara:strand:- start:1008 stop:2333 length:1326 start_codon:yes stop_codon:yes gene_type:complete
MQLYEYQKKGVSFLKSRQRALLFDDMGLGKTVQAIKAADYDYPILVVCPAFLRFNWESELKMWGYPHPVSIIKKKKDFRFPVGKEAVILSYSMLPLASDLNKLLAEAYTDVDSDDKKITLIADEAHAVKNYKAKRTKKFRSVAQRVISLDGVVWAMTGTPLMNKPNELWGLLKSIDLNKESYRTWENFVRLFRGYKNQWNGWDWGTPHPSAALALKRVALGRRKRDVLPDLPGKTRGMIEVDISKPVMKMCDTILDELKAHGIDPKDIASSQLTQRLKIEFESIAKIREAVARGKIPAMLDWLGAFEELELPLVVFGQHRAAIDAIESREGWRTITGSTPASKRNEYIKQFQNGELKGIAGTIGAMGTGVTLTKASHMLFVDLSWVPGDNLQAEDRICRIGQKFPCNYYILTAKHPMDKLVTNALMSKMSIINNSVGLAYA